MAVVVVIGFPSGVQHACATRAEAAAVSPYADEFDMVMHRTAVANADHEAIVDDVRAVREAVGDATLKCSIESPTLDEDEIRTAAELVAEGGADVVKTAVGYAGGCDPAEIRAMREPVGTDVGVKASGGIHSFEEVLAMVEARTTHIGASAGVAIVESIEE